VASGPFHPGVTFQRFSFQHFIGISATFCSFPAIRSAIAALAKAKAYSQGGFQISAFGVAERIVAEKLSRPRWTGNDLATRRKSDPGKLGMAARIHELFLSALKIFQKRETGAGVWPLRLANAKKRRPVIEPGRRL
jgi:hypothetical protein